MRRLLLLVLALLSCSAVVAAAGCGSDGASSSGAASLAPAGSLVYGEVALSPSGGQGRALEDLVARFPGEGSAGDRIQSLMEKLFTEAETPLSYREDVEPWLGDEAAFFVSNVRPEGDDADAALLVATEDEDATVAAIEKAGDARRTEHDGTDVWVHDGGEEAAAVVDGWLALGTPGAIEAAIDTAGGDDPIEDADRFRETLEDAPEERLGFVYVDMRGFLESVRGMPGMVPLGPFRALLGDPILVTADAGEAGVRFEATIPSSIAAGLPIVAEGTGAAGELPADAWVALSQPELGRTVDTYVDLVGSAAGGRDVVEEQFEAMTGLDLEKDVTSWMGDWSAFVSGTSVEDLGGAVIVETDDEEASGRFVDGLARLARRTAGQSLTVGPLDVAGGGEGVTMRSRNYPEPIHLFQRDGRVVAAFGDAAANDAIDPAEPLSGTAGFARAEEALGGDYQVSLFLAFEPILALAEASGAGSDPDFAEAKPYLEPLGALVGGSSRDGDELRAAFALTVE
jgi:Protein of unknown function (DUF3352)